MLVLSRKRGESVMIGDDIKIKILDVRDGKVRIGFEAAALIPVHRLEVYQSIKRSEEQSSHHRNVAPPSELTGRFAEGRALSDSDLG